MKLIKPNGDVLELTIEEYRELFKQEPQFYPYPIYPVEPYPWQPPVIWGKPMYYRTWTSDNSKEE